MPTGYRTAQLLGGLLLVVSVTLVGCEGSGDGLDDDPVVSQKVIGVTSESNKRFVEALNCCDQIVTYGNECEIDNSLPTAYVDMSGNSKLTKVLHSHIDDNVVASVMVGASHWENGGQVGELPGAKPKFFFAPEQIAKRDKEWGPGALMMKAMEASFTVSGKAKNIMWKPKGPWS